MNSWFYEKDADACRDMLSEDSLIVVPDQSEHFLTREDAGSWLRDQIRRSGPRQYVDIVSMKSTPGEGAQVYVSYEISLIPANAREAVSIWCSLGIGGREDPRIFFVHMSDKTGDSRNLTARVRDLLAHMPAGFLLIEGRQDVFQVLYASDFFPEKFKYSREDFENKARQNPFFFFIPGEDRKFARTLRACMEEGKPLSAKSTLTGSFGQRMVFQIQGMPLENARSAGVLYLCLFQDITGYQTISDQLSSQLHIQQEILRGIPGCACVLQRQGQETKVLYVSREVQDMFGLGPAVFSEAVAKDIFYGLEMTGITRKRLLDQYVSMPAQDPDCGMFRIERPDGTSLWVELFLSARDSGRDRDTIFLFYLDRDRQRREMNRQQETSEMISRIRSQQAREDIESARKKADLMVEEEKEKTRKLLESKEEELDRRLEVRLKNAEQREKELLGEYQAYQESAAAKLSLMEKALRETREKLRVQERELEDRLRRQAEDYEARISGLEEKLAQKQEEQSLRRIEQETGQIRAAQRARMKTKEESVLADSLERLELVPGRSLEEAERLQEAIARDFAEMTRIEPDSLTADVFMAQDAVRNIMLYQSPRCTRRGIGLVMQTGRTYPREVMGDRARLQSVLVSLLDFAVDNTPEGGRIALTYTSDWPSRGRVNMRFRLRFDAAAFSLGELQDLDRVRGNPVREGLLVAREDMERMGGSMQITEAGRESSEITIWVSMAVPDRKR